MKPVNFVLPTITALSLLFGKVSYDAAEAYDFDEKLVQAADTGEITQGYAVLTGGSAEEGLARIRAGIQLTEQNPGSKLLISGGHPDYTIVDFIAEFEPNIPNEDITFWTAANTTQGNGMEVQRWLEINRLSSFTFVTGGTQATRAYAEFSDFVPITVAMRAHIITEYPKPWSTQRAEQVAKHWCAEREWCNDQLRAEPLNADLPSANRSQYSFTHG